MKAAREWFKCLPKDIQCKATANTSHKGLSGKQNSLSSAIGTSFYWDETEEGNDFWNKIYDKAESGEYDEVV